MSQGVYTSRLIKTQTTGVWVSWVCPAGQRAVVRTILALANVSGGQTITVMVAGVNVFWHSFLAGISYVSSETRAVIYAGESVSVYLQAGALDCTISGFVFADSPGRAVFEDDGHADPSLEPPEDWFLTTQRTAEGWR